MGSLKKKLTKVLRKITPKEIAPALPIAAMFIPGMQGLSPMWKFALPQLLTAAGSARTSGKISGLNQVLAGIGSLAGINASNQALQAGAPINPNLTPNIANVGSPGAMASQSTTLQSAAQSAAQQQAAAQLAANQQGLSGVLSSGAEALGNAPIIGGTFNTLGQGMTNLSSTLPFGNVSGAPYNPQFGWNMLAPASLGAGMMATDAAELDKVEAAERAAARKDAYRNYLDQISNLTAYYGNLGPLNQQFGPWNYITAKEGGRVGASGGGIMDWIMRNWGLGKYDSNIDESYLPELSLEEQAMQDLKDRYSGILGPLYKMYDKHTDTEFFDPMNTGGRVGHAGGDMVGDLGAMHPMNPAPSAVAPNMPSGMQVDGRNGTFIPMGAQEKHDDVPAMLAKNEFVMTSDAVKGMGNGDVNLGAQRMYDLMNNLEANV